MKVYVLASESLVDGTIEVATEVFSNHEKAKEEFDFLVKHTKEHDYLMDKEDVIIEELEESFLIYEDGYYTENHYGIWIEEKELK